VSRNNHFGMAHEFGSQQLIQPCRLGSLRRARQIDTLGNRRKSCFDLWLNLLSP
jgi:hypothetical protein